ncbi:cation-dependent mannose-6-phosphate receptor-like [Leptidea sinapis]|uniref:cation-dependent mannose-6-phosphate receptor-like n=1 Tax=Leptidea sinapis TaxID=189913 RepID=UPI0021245A2F|nr:cation-dependent mannose-6-phosphate receptor-like [Leptidea sinapis]
MESKLCIFGIVLFCITFNTNIVSAQDVCVKKGPCSCEFSNGTGINLSPLANAAFYSTNTFDLKSEGTQYELSTYYYHPCIDAKPVVNSTKTTDSCGIPLAICRQVDTFNFNKIISGYVTDGGIYEYMGSSNFSQFSSDGKSIIYMNPPSSTIVMLVCAQTDGELNVISLSDPQKIVLSFYSRYACLTQIEELSRSLGSTLLIIFFSCVIFYIVLGVCVNKLLRGATGLEVVPNLAFWTDLPNLVKDGWVFTLNGFKLPARGAGPVTSPDPNSYDSI